jgi:exo-1,4-beta-D-glucosaminidase
VFTSGRQALPIRWSDNDITLWPGEQQTITARYRAGTKPVIRLSGYNLKTRAISAG